MSIRSRIVVTNIALFAIVLAAVAWIVYDRTRESERTRIDSLHDVLATELIAEFDDEMEDGVDASVFVADSIDVFSHLDARIRLVDSSGQLLFQRGEAMAGPVAGSPPHKILRRDIVIEGAPYRESVRAVAIDERTGYVLTLATSSEEARVRLHSLLFVLSGTAAGALLLAAFAVYLLTGRAFRPITQMVDTAEQISAATLHNRLVLPATADEVYRLGESLNRMMERIELAFKSQRRFLADASHELQTPLTVMYGELEYLKRQIDSGPQGESIDIVLTEIDRLSHMVSQLLLIARIDAQRLTISQSVVRLDEVLADCVRLIRARAEQFAVTLDLHVAEAVEIEGESEHLKRAVLNVIDNAVKYSPGKSVVSVTMNTSDEWAEIQVSDHGIGIAEEDISKVFERFHRSPSVRKDRSGSGLGLAIARELIRAHGGEITIASEIKAGTTVTIRLPFRLPDDCKVG